MPRHMIQSILFVSITLTASYAHAIDFGDLINKELGSLGKPTPQNSTPAASSSTPATTETLKSATNLANFSNNDQVSSLKQALIQGAETAVASLSKENGYLGNNKVRIPLPESLQKADSLLRKFGMGKYADDLTTSINRAAETAVPEAKDLLVGAVNKMTVDDAKSILTGGSDAATQYFRKNTEAALAGKFKPVVATSIQKVKLAETYDQFAEKGVQFGLVDKRDTKMDDYITRKAMDGLFVMMAEQEKAIRANPLEATGNLAKKIFSAIKF
ncbi:conserved exported hypothetical protein [Candidatus Nitrotoga sp. HW29]|uniref:DUF4197 domain-containing protein n=1 Tax=Candidatus Nitrotoga sp. HW29 TaxID=2886963 RepID=UPI001FA0386B|nr:DUF4197 domain-containing protein [Candidatus Nitrotoga sp. HW29]CAH1904024.1 conserved exported hypothetical protein [Candidatus Nitrotoga sp. HW29]